MSNNFSDDAIKYGLKGFADFDFGTGQNIFRDYREDWGETIPFYPYIHGNTEPRYELAIDLLMNTLNKRDILGIKQEMDKFHERDVTLKMLRKANVIDKCTIYLLNHTDKSMDDLMEAIELLVERLN